LGRLTTDLPAFESRKTPDHAKRGADANALTRLSSDELAHNNTLAQKLLTFRQVNGIQSPDNTIPLRNH
jgi:hypothetical protein